jgi:pantoate--beta-alanine ligase
VIELVGLAEMRAWSRAERARGRRIGFVPTMGALHEGHLRLVDAARERTDRVVMSVFVNPLQFGPGEDFARYPRDLGRDRTLAAERAVDCLFVPDAREMYPSEPVIRIAPGPLGEGLEGAIRPGHFSGVLTVVAKLFHQVEPDVAVFGRKDFQQATLIRRMATDLDFPIAIDVAPTVRELDGLALSSRNAYLTADQRRAALGLSRALRAIEQGWRGGEADPAILKRRGLDALGGPAIMPDYLELVDETLQPVRHVNAKTIALVAARVGTTRLIDNVILGEGLAADPTVRSRP